MHPTLRRALVAGTSLAAVLSTSPFALTPRQVAADVSAAATGTFTENFSTTTYIDGGATNADVNTALGRVQLPQGTADFYKADNVTLGKDEVTTDSDTDHNTNKYSLAVDSQGRPAIAMMYHFNDDIYVRRWNGSMWTGFFNTGINDFDAISVPLGDGAEAPAIAFDPSDRPVVAWQDSSGAQLAHWTGSTWTGYDTVNPDANNSTFEFDTLSGSGATPSLAVDASGNPHVAWSEGVSIEYARWNGSSYVGQFGAAPETVSSAGLGNTLPDLALNASGVPFVVWENFSSGPDQNVRLAYANSGSSAWTGLMGAPPDETSAQQNVQGSLAIDPSGRPVLSWLGDVSDEIHVQHWDGSTYRGYIASGALSDDQLTPSADSSANAVIQSDSSGRPVIAWEEADLSPGTFADIAVARFNGSAYVALDGSAGFTRVDPPVEDSSFTVSMVVGTLDDQPHLAWTDDEGFPNYQLAYTHWFAPYLSPRTAQSTTIDTVGESIYQATLTATHTLNGAAVTYQLSNDGGANFYTVTPGVPFTFPTGGSDLRWRAILTTGNPAFSPTIDELTISFSTSLTRFGSDSPLDLAIQVSQQFPAGSAGAVIFCRADIIADCLASVPLASRTNATLLLTDTDVVSTSVIAEAKRAVGDIADKKTYLAGGLKAISQAVADQLNGEGFTKQERFAGVNRDDTSQLVSRAVVALNPALPTTVFISEDKAFADVLGIGPIVGAKQLDGNVSSLLLQPRGSKTLNKYLVSFLKDNPSIKTAVVVGGNTALPREIDGKLQAQFTNIKTVTRFAGVERFSTNADMNNVYFPAPTKVVLASGVKSTLPGATSVQASALPADFFAALLAGIVGMRNSAPVVLVQPTSLPEPSAKYIDDHSGTLVEAIVVGTTAEVSDAVVLHAQSLL